MIPGENRACVPTAWRTPWARANPCISRRLARIQRQRPFAKDMLASLEGGQDDWVVQGDAHGDRDQVDFGERTMDS